MTKTIIQNTSSKGFPELNFTGKKAPTKRATETTKAIILCDNDATKCFEGLFNNATETTKDTPLLPEPSDKALNAHRIHNEKLAEAADKGRNIGYTVDGKHYLATRGGEIEFTENGKTVKMDANGNPVKTSVTEPSKNNGHEADKNIGNDTDKPVNDDKNKPVNDDTKQNKIHKYTKQDQQLHELREQRKRLQDEIDHLSQEKQKLNKNIKKMTKDGNASKAEIEQLKQEQTKLQQKIKNLTNERINLGAKVKELRAQRKVLQKEVTDLNKKNQELNANNKVLQNKVTGLTDDLAKTSKQLAKWKKGGIIGGIVAAAGLIGMGIALLNKNKKNDAVAEDTTPVVAEGPVNEGGTTPAITTPGNEGGTPPVVTTPGNGEDTTPVVTTPGNEEEENTAKKEYEVKKGDCVWNIAKAALKEELGRIPTNKEILERTRKIVDNPENELVWSETKKGFVLITPGQKLNIAA